MINLADKSRKWDCRRSAFRDARYTTRLKMVSIFLAISQQEFGGRQVFPVSRQDSNRQATFIIAAISAAGRRGKDRHRMHCRILSVTEIPPYLFSPLNNSRGMYAAMAL
jgi:hypothetical protein